MTFVERRLNQSILRKEILRELSFLLEQYKEYGGAEEGYGPVQAARAQSQFAAKAIGTLGSAVAKTGEVVSDISGTISNNLTEFYKTFKKSSWDEISNALKLIRKDIIWIFINDPAAAVCFMLDLFSVVDPSGFADLTQGIIYLSKGDLVNAAVCLIFGGVQLKDSLTAVATGGAAVPLAVATKAEIIALKLSIKSGKGAKKIIEILLDPKLQIAINKLKQHKSAEFKRAGQFLERLVSKAKRYDQYGITPTNEKRILDDILGGDVTKFDEATNRAARLEFDKIIRENSPPKYFMQALGAVQSVASTAMTSQELQQPVNVYENFLHWCGLRIDHCDLINIDKNLTLTYKPGVDVNSKDAKYAMEIAENTLEYMSKRQTEYKYTNIKKNESKPK